MTFSVPCENSFATASSVPPPLFVVPVVWYVGASVVSHMFNITELSKDWYAKESNKNLKFTNSEPHVSNANTVAPKECRKEVKDEGCQSAYSANELSFKMSSQQNPNNNSGEASTPRLTSRHSSQSNEAQVSGWMAQVEKLSTFSEKWDVLRNGSGRNSKCQCESNSSSMKRGLVPDRAKCFFNPVFCQDEDNAVISLEPVKSSRLMGSRTIHPQPESFLAPAASALAVERENEVCNSFYKMTIQEEAREEEIVQGGVRGREKEEEAGEVENECKVVETTSSIVVKALKEKDANINKNMINNNINAISKYASSIRNIGVSSNISSSSNNNNNIRAREASRRITHTESEVRAIIEKKLGIKFMGKGRHEVNPCNSDVAEQRPSSRRSRGAAPAVAMGADPPKDNCPSSPSSATVRRSRGTRPPMATAGPTDRPQSRHSLYVPGHVRDSAESVHERRHSGSWRAVRNIDISVSRPVRKAAATGGISCA